MPFIRTLTVGFVVLLLCLALAGPAGHPFFTEEGLWLTVVLAVVLWSMSLVRNFFLDLVVLLFIAYFLQRIAVVYFWPQALDYQDYLSYAPAIFTSAVRFALACAAAVWVGYGLSQLIRGRTSQNRVASLDVIRVGNMSAPFEALFLCYAAFAIPLALYGIGLTLTTGVGAAGFEYDPSWAVLYRISLIANSSGFLAMLALLKSDITPTNRKLAVTLILLQVFSAMQKTSKGVLLSMAMTFIVCFYFTRGRIPSRYFWYGGGLILFTVLVYFPAMMAFRSGYLTLLQDTGSWIDLLQGLEALALANYDLLLFSFSERLGGFDWLMGLMTIGREAFPAWVSPQGDLIQALNSLIPGDLIEQPDWVSINMLIPVMLRGQAAVHGLGGHAELTGILGMAYVHYGVFFGPLFFAVWSFVSSYILMSRLSIVLKVLYIFLFVVVLGIGGGLTTVIIRFYEGLISLILAYALYQWFYKIGPICVGKARRILEAASA